MPEARDRLSRPEDVAAAFLRRRRLIRATGIYTDEPDVSPATPLGPGALTTMGARRLTGTAVRVGQSGRGSIVRPRSRYPRGRGLYGSPASVGRQNVSPAGSGPHVRIRSSNSVLPSWYPRTPLADITSFVMAIERRRARLRVIEGRQVTGSSSQDMTIVDPSGLSPDAQLEHYINTSAHHPKIGTKNLTSSVGKVHKILLDITKQNPEKPDCITPQKKLLNSIDSVEKVVMDELRKLKGTPSAKKAEREKRVRTLMSMR